MKKYILAALAIFFLVFNANAQAPTDINLSSLTVDENAPVNTVVGTLSAVPASPVPTYTITSGDANFNISGTSLRTSVVFNHEGTDSYDITIQADNGTPPAYSEPFTITINDVNEAPVITSNEGGATAAVSRPENTTAVTTVTATDVDLPAQTLTYSISGGVDAARFSIVAATGVLTFSAAPNYEIPTDANTDNIYNVQVTVRDNGTGTLTDVQAIAVTVTNVNDAPVITSNGGGATANVNRAENTTAVTTVTATDADLPAQTLTYSITGGADATSFSIVAASGVLTFSSAPNYEIPTDANTDNIYNVQVTVRDNGTGTLSDVQAIAVTVTDANDPPEFTSSPILAASEGELYTYNITTSDEDDDTRMIANVGALPAWLTLTDIGDGTATLAGIPADEDVGSHSITLRVNDGTVNVYQPFTIIVTDVQHYPVLAGIETDILQYTEEDGPANITSSITVTDADNDDILSAQVRIVSGRVNDEDRLDLTPSTFAVGYNESTGILDISGTGTIAEYQAALRNVTYENINDTNPDTGTRLISFRVSDDYGNSNLVQRQVKVNGDNDAPWAANVIITGPNNHYGTLLTGSYVFSDPEGDDEGESIFRWDSASTGTGGGSGTISGATGSNTFTPDIQYEGRYLRFTVTPVDEYGEVGTPVASDWFYVDAAPEFTTLTIVNDANPGVFAVNEIVRANTVFIDADGDGEGTHEYQWYRADDALGGNTAALGSETDETYEIGAVLKDRFLAVEVIPHATDGSTPGEAQWSSWYSVSELPTATISGDTTICNGTEGSISVVLTGEGPWEFSYEINDANETTVSVPDHESPYEYFMPVTLAGSYTLTQVSDNNYDGNVFGSALVSYHPAVSATLPLSEFYVCSVGSGDYELPVNLGGSSPWSFSYRNLDDPPADSMMISGISDASSFIPVGAADIGTYQLLHVWDANCVATGTGTSEVLLRTSPIATMSGDTAVCPGEPTIIDVELTGTGPWQFTYTRGGTGPTTISVPNNPSPYTYELGVSQTGLYELTEVSNLANEGCVTGSAEVLERTLPTATISGNETICEGTSLDIEVELTGPVKRWSFIYQHDSDPPVTISEIGNSPYVLTVDEEGNYEIIEVSDTYCSNTGNGEVNITIQEAPEVSLSGLGDIYSLQSANPILTVNPTGGNFDESDYAGAIQFLTGNWTFIPVIAYAYGSPFKVVYSWEDPGTNCIGRAMDTVRIVSTAAEIQVNNYYDTIGKRYCFNDKPILIEGVNIEKEIGSFSIEGGVGLIDPDPNDNKAFLLPSVIESGTKTVNYSVYFPGEGWKFASKDFTFQKVEADFAWDNECYEEGSLVNFYDNSDAGSAVLDSHYWAFYLPEEIIIRSDSSVSLAFDNMATTNIVHIVGSEYGCYDTISKDLVLRPTIEVFESAYEANFLTGRSNWQTYPIEENGTNSWNFGEPPGDVFVTGDGMNAWYTEILDLEEGEQSYVISPCFDFSGSERPMIKMDIWRAFSSFDGAVLQYTVDNGKNWFGVGGLDDGIKWYNEYNINGIPGGQGIGWSDEKDTKWENARHKLDVVQGDSLVRFRIAYGAPDGQVSTRNGFAFRNIWIGERTKKVLVEHFTTAGDTLCRSTINEEFNTLINFNNEDVIDIQYHMGYPTAESDTFYYLNPGPSDAREYYYTLPRIPYGIIDGGRNGSNKYLLNYCEEEFEQIDLTKAVLIDNPFDLDVQSSVSGNSLTIDVTVKALEDRDQEYLTLQVAVVERLIKDVVGDNGENRFESVLRDMVPNVQGTSFDRSWTDGDSEYLSFDWYIQDVFDAEELRVVVFIQDDETKEVYQAEFDNPYGGHSGIEEETEEMIGNNMLIYPNPAYDNVSVQFKDPLRNTAILQLLDNTGRIITMQQMHSGEQFTNLSLSGIDSGIYIVRLFDNKDVLFTKKLIVLDNK